LGVTEQLEGGQEEGSSDVEAVAGVGELGRDLFALGLDGVELAAKLVLGPARGADEVEVLVLLGVQFPQAGGQSLLELGGGCRGR
jgi:hypothetical protein